MTAETISTSSVKRNIHDIEGGRLQEWMDGVRENHERQKALQQRFVWQPEANASIEMKKKDRNWKEIADEIRKKYPKGLPLELFILMTERFPTSCLESILYKKDKDTGETSILLVRRPDTDPIEEWRGKWHLGGGVQLNESPQQTVESLKNREINNAGITLSAEIGFVDVKNIPTERGREIATIVAIEIQELPERLPSGYEMYNINSIPEDTIGFHKKMISLAIPMIESNNFRSLEELYLE